MKSSQIDQERSLQSRSQVRSFWKEPKSFFTTTLSKEKNQQKKGLVFIRKIAKRDGRILYFGDNYITDCLACQANKQTDAVCIMEELDPSTKLCEDSLWGDYFKDTFDGKEVENYFVSLMKENVALIASSCYDPALIKFYGLDQQ